MRTGEIKRSALWGLNCWWNGILYHHSFPSVPHVYFLDGIYGSACCIFFHLSCSYLHCYFYSTVFLPHFLFLLNFCNFSQVLLVLFLNSISSFIVFSWNKTQKQIFISLTGQNQKDGQTTSSFHLGWHLGRICGRIVCRKFKTRWGSIFPMDWL